jgi:DNA-binding NtrC family response regulator
MTRLLLIEADPQRGQRMQAALVASGYQVDLSAVANEPGDAQCIVANAEFIEPLTRNLADLPPVVIFALGASVPEAARSIKAEISNYLAYPVATTELVGAIAGAVNTPQGNASDTESFTMVGSSPPMRDLKACLQKVAPTGSAVLIQGESGTGKALVARAIHATSDRSNGPLITLNCNAIPEQLIETELFGHDSHPSSDTSRRHGLIEAAWGGTLFLDEVGDLPLEAQSRLLQLLQEQEVLRSASAGKSVRLIAATHRDLDSLMKSGTFREDLYYRLNVVSIDLPPLRERGDDILELSNWLLKRTVGRLKRKPMRLSREAARLLTDYHWPGNVRELENAIERAVILCDGEEIDADLLAISPAQDKPAPDAASDDPDHTSLEDYFVRFVHEHQEHLTETELAQKLGISRKSLWERRQRLNIPRKKTRKRGPRRPDGA